MKYFKIFFTLILIFGSYLGTEFYIVMKIWKQTSNCIVLMGVTSILFFIGAFILLNSNGELISKKEREDIKKENTKDDNRFKTCAQVAFELLRGNTVCIIDNEGKRGYMRVEGGRLIIQINNSRTKYGKTMQLEDIVPHKVQRMMKSGTRFYRNGVIFTVDKEGYVSMYKGGF